MDRAGKGRGESEWKRKRRETLRQGREQEDLRAVCHCVTRCVDGGWRVATGERVRLVTGEMVTERKSVRV